MLEVANLKEIIVNHEKRVRLYKPFHDLHALLTRNDIFLAGDYNGKAWRDDGILLRHKVHFGGYTIKGVDRASTLPISSIESNIELAELANNLLLDCYQQLSNCFFVGTNYFLFNGSFSNGVDFRRKIKVVGSRVKNNKTIEKERIALGLPDGTDCGVSVVTHFQENDMQKLQAIYPAIHVNN